MSRAVASRLIERYGTGLAGVLLFALGVTLALVTAELDLSFANVASLAAVVTGYLVHKGYSVPLAVASGLGVGLVGGFFNGLLVTRLKIPSLIATLGTAALANGFAFWHLRRQRRRQVDLDPHHLGRAGAERRRDERPRRRSSLPLTERRARGRHRDDLSGPLPASCDLAERVSRCLTDPLRPVPAGRCHPQ
jgi:uncharacterized membrane protein YccC